MKVHQVICGFLLAFLGLTQFALGNRYGKVARAIASQDTNLLNEKENTPNQELRFEADFVKIPAGSFWMGSPNSESGRDGYYWETLHRVLLTHDFEMQTTEVTQTQWLRIMRYNPSYYGYGSPMRPVERVSWNETQEFIKILNDSQSVYTYRLPTEAEWEYAARGGTSTAYSFGDDVSNLDRYGWFRDNSKVDNYYQGQEVALKEKNQFGLYDMHGNVGEWVEDIYGIYTIYSVSDANFEYTDPLRKCCVELQYRGPGVSVYNPEDQGNAFDPKYYYQPQVIRGGSFYYGAQSARSASRRSGDPIKGYHDVGFRLVRTLR